MPSLVHSISSSSAPIKSRVSNSASSFRYVSKDKLQLLGDIRPAVPPGGKKNNVGSSRRRSSRFELGPTTLPLSSGTSSASTGRTPSPKADESADRSLKIKGSSKQFLRSHLRTMARLTLPHSSPPSPSTHATLTLTNIHFNFSRALISCVFPLNAVHTMSPPCWKHEAKLGPAPRLGWKLHQADHH